MTIDEIKQKIQSILAHLNDSDLKSELLLLRTFLQSLISLENFIPSLESAATRLVSDDTFLANEVLTPRVLEGQVAAHFRNMGLADSTNQRFFALCVQCFFIPQYQAQEIKIKILNAIFEDKPNDTKNSIQNWNILRCSALNFLVANSDSNKHSFTYLDSTNLYNNIIKWLNNDFDLNDLETRQYFHAVGIFLIKYIFKNWIDYPNNTLTTNWNPLVLQVILKFSRIESMWTESFNTESLLKFYATTLCLAIRSKVEHHKFYQMAKNFAEQTAHTPTVAHADSFQLMATGFNSIYQTTEALDCLINSIQFYMVYLITAPLEFREKTVKNIIQAYKDILLADNIVLLEIPSEIIKSVFSPTKSATSSTSRNSSKKEIPRLILQQLKDFLRAIHTYKDDLKTLDDAKKIISPLFSLLLDEQYLSILPKILQEKSFKEAAQEHKQKIDDAFNTLLNPTLSKLIASTSSWSCMITKHFLASQETEKNLRACILTITDYLADQDEIPIAIQEAVDKLKGTLPSPELNKGQKKSSDFWKSNSNNNNNDVDKTLGKRKREQEKDPDQTQSLGNG